MPVTQDVLVLATDDRIWFDADSLIRYLRDVEGMANGFFLEAEREGEFSKAVAAHATGDLMRQIADGLVLTSMTAAETIRSRRESRR